jgi:hypothetical protein
MGKYKAFNGPAPTTAAQASVASGTSVKTFLQLKAGTGKGLIITGWGYSLDTEQAAAGTIELLKTDVAATVTAFVAGDVTALATPSTASTLSLGTAASGYTASAEGSITATDMYDAIKLPVSTTTGPHMTYNRLFGKDERPYLPAGGILRVRATTGTSAGLICWVSWIE